MATKNWKRTNSFMYGEIGERLSGIRESQVYEEEGNSDHVLFQALLRASSASVCSSLASDK